MKSWNEIRKAATAFSKRGKNAFDEKAQSFLKVNAAQALGDGKTKLFVGGSWMLDIPAGCTLTVHALRDRTTGKYLPSGTYGKAGSGAKRTNLSAHFAGDGLLCVRRRCTTLSFR